ncbi:hypothetical protein [Streptomyces sp. NPDC086023]|uniref:hypothetical protein n=1 Tax=Streptomyces sp. NPDC086023 TaxID=3365746 RepID=UPI0037CFD77C
MNPQALMPELHAIQGAKTAADLLVPAIGDIHDVNAKVHKDTFGNGTDYSRHTVKKATNLFRIKFTYSKNRSALVTANPIVMAARGIKKAAEGVKLRADQAMYSKDNAVVLGDKHDLEKFDIKTRFVVPLELTFDLTPFTRYPAREYEAYKLKMAAAAERGEDFPPYDGPEYKGDTLSDYLQITTLDLHLGAHVNVINANSEPLKVYADVLPDDHTSDRETRFIRVLLHFRSPGMRAFPQKLEEDYELRFEVRRDGTWDYAPEELPDDATEIEKKLAMEREEEVQAHFKFHKPKQPKIGSQKHQKKMEKRVETPASFVFDPDVAAEDLTQEQIDGAFRQIIDLAVHGKIDGAEKALTLIVEQANLKGFGLGFILATRLKEFGIDGFPKKILDDTQYPARPLLHWLHDRMGAEIHVDQVIDLILKGRRRDLLKVRTVLDKEFGTNKPNKVNFLVKAAAKRGVLMSPPPGLTLSELFAAIREAFRKTPETTVLPRPKPADKEEASRELIPQSEDGVDKNVSPAVRTLCQNLAKADRSTALKLLTTYRNDVGARTFSGALYHLVQAAHIEFRDATSFLTLQITEMSPYGPLDTTARGNDIDAAIDALDDVRSAMAMM